MSLCILYATVGGTTEQIARQAADYLTARGHAVECVDVSLLAASDLAAWDRVIFGCSTYDEGEMNPLAAAFFDQLAAARVKAPHVRVAIFGLGESIYPSFCTGADRAGEAWEVVGANVVSPILKLDMLEWDADARTRVIHDWLDEILPKLAAGRQA